MIGIRSAGNAVRHARGPSSTLPRHACPPARHGARHRPTPGRPGGRPPPAGSPARGLNGRVGPRNTEPSTSPSTSRADASGGDPLVSVLVAAYNEEDTVESVVRRVAELPFRSEIVVVDDGSVDGTRALLEGLERAGEVEGLRVLAHDRNRGKGAAVRTAIDASRGDIVVIQDADLEYDPRDLPRLLQPILEGHADVVFGTRLRGGQPQR